MGRRHLDPETARAMSLKARTYGAAGIATLALDPETPRSQQEGLMRIAAKIIVTCGADAMPPMTAAEFAASWED